ncbi:unnamed protein product, partial [Staurois parvus]
MPTGHFYPPSCLQGTSTPFCLQGTSTPFLPRTIFSFHANTGINHLPTGHFYYPLPAYRALLPPSCLQGTSTPFLPTGHFYPLPAQDNFQL